jgi:hypothetical protein
MDFRIWKWMLDFEPQRSTGAQLSSVPRLSPRQYYWMVWGFKRWRGTPVGSVSFVKVMVIFKNPSMLSHWLMSHKFFLWEL